MSACVCVCVCGYGVSYMSSETCLYIGVRSMKNVKFIVCKFLCDYEDVASHVMYDIGCTKKPHVSWKLLMCAFEYACLSNMNAR